MLNIDNVDGGLLLVQTDGQPTSGDYVELVTRREWFVIVRGTPLHKLIKLGPRFEGWTPDRLLGGVRLDPKQPHPIARIVIVSKERWKERGVRASGTPLIGEARLFDAA